MSEIPSSNTRKIEVIHSPSLFSDYYEGDDCVVVIIDIFRATTTIIAAFENGIDKIIPVATLEEAREYKAKGFLTAAERNGEIVKGFDFGNSPLGLQKEMIENKTLVLTTTNGTRAIEIAKSVHKVIIGAFTNISVVCDFLEKEDKDVLLLCAGWRGRFNLEDTLFAGAVAHNLSQNLRFRNLSDSTIASIQMYEKGKDDLYAFLSEASHRKRLSKLNLEEDIIYCLTKDQSEIVPVLEGKELINFEKEYKNETTA